MGAAAGFDGSADLAEAFGDGAGGRDFTVVGCCGEGGLVGVGMEGEGKMGWKGGKDGMEEREGRKMQGEDEDIRHAAEIAFVSAETEEVSRIL